MFDRPCVFLPLTAKDEREENTATLEEANLADEQGSFLRHANAKRIYSSLFDKTNGASPGYAQRLNGSANERYGLARSISVMPGDTVRAEVYAKYVDPESANWTTALNTLIGQISAGTTGIVFEGSAYGTSTSSFPGAFVQETNDGGGPKAYLNWLIFDKNYNLIDGGWDQMTDQPKEQGQDVAHEVLMSPDLVITEPGYVYIYLSNEEETLDDYSGVFDPPIPVTISPTPWAKRFDDSKLLFFR